MVEDDRPNPDRVALVVMEPGRPFVHYCAVCGAWGAFGCEVDLSTGRLGRWYCTSHKPDAK